MVRFTAERDLFRWTEGVTVASALLSTYTIPKSWKSQKICSKTGERFEDNPEEEEGVTSAERVYGWPDFATLIWNKRERAINLAWETEGSFPNFDSKYSWNEEKMRSQIHLVEWWQPFFSLPKKRYLNVFEVAVEDHPDLIDAFAQQKSASHRGGLV
jgi:hypothetical protein